MAKMDLFNKNEENINIEEGEDFDLMGESFVGFGFPPGLVEDSMNRLKTNPKLRARWDRKKKYLNHLVDTGQVTIPAGPMENQEEEEYNG